ncbi:DUF411 domain-containing protein [Natrinema sp. 1APR25-10V2]|uniref:DUF411 domain-containing protein n=1 Tax=Natrinema sp. 1APR25-10V2 TaxID=2951081 RepID=UPI0028762F89|nr:DUF411 domain-containing protein [Natrinema sp. 1APR25-10V2]MDS0475481.1 hypothetical protein [Natrinema sp. 1APR25-10V2]
MPAQWTRRRFLRLGGVTGALGVAGCFGDADENRSEIEDAIAVTNARQYNAPECRCCERYASTLRDSIDGEITETVPEDIGAIKREYGVPEGLRSCHTLVIDEYVVEGHVPVEAIGTLLTEQPDIDGIALPGMPAGAPGMGGQKEARFAVYAIGGDRTGTEFTTV